VNIKIKHRLLQWLLSVLLFWLLFHQIVVAKKNTDTYIHIYTHTYKYTNIYVHIIIKSRIKTEGE